MALDMRTVITDALRDMSFEVGEVADDTVLGDGGLFLESLSMAELVMRLGDHGATFTDDELDSLITMTFGEFASEAARRVEAQPAID
jgi:acyl carrier protein